MEKPWQRTYVHVRVYVRTRVPWYVYVHKNDSTQALSSGATGNLVGVVTYHGGTYVVVVVVVVAAVPSRF